MPQTETEKDKGEVAQEVSPLRRFRESLGLSQGQVLGHIHVSPALLSLAESGKRTAPAAVLGFYCLRGAPKTLGEEQERWRRDRGLSSRSRPTFVFTCRLPAGLSVEQARQKCAEALAEFMAEGAAR